MSEDTQAAAIIVCLGAAFAGVAFVLGYDIGTDTQRQRHKASVAALLSWGDCVPCRMDADGLNGTVLCAGQRVTRYEPGAPLRLGDGDRAMEFR